MASRKKRAVEAPASLAYAGTGMEPAPAKPKRSAKPKQPPVLVRIASGDFYGWRGEDMIAVFDGQLELIVDRTAPSLDPVIGMNTATLDSLRFVPASLWREFQEAAGKLETIIDAIRHSPMAHYTLAPGDAPIPVDDAPTAFAPASA